MQRSGQEMHKNRQGMRTSKQGMHTSRQETLGPTALSPAPILVRPCSPLQCITNAAKGLAPLQTASLLCSKRPPPPPLKVQSLGPCHG